MAQDYTQALKELLLELREITIQAMASQGVSESSDLAKSVKYVLTKDGIQMEVLQYYPWLDTGHKVKRHAGARKVPIQVLVQWIKAKNLIPRNKKTGRFMTTNQMAFAIQTAIYKNGISGKVKSKGKNYSDKVANDVADYSAVKMADALAMQIANDLVDMFQPLTNQ